MRFLGQPGVVTGAEAGGCGERADESFYIMRGETLVKRGILTVSLSSFDQI